MCLGTWQPELARQETLSPVPYLEAALKEYDGIYIKHSRLQAEFQDNQILKSLLAEAVDARFQLANKQAVLIQLWRAGARDNQLERCRDASRYDFVGVQLPDDCGYSWREIFGAGNDGLQSCKFPLRIPLELPSCQSAAIWDAVLSLEKQPLIELESVRVSIAELVPVLVLVDIGLHLAKFGNTIAGLAASACNIFTSVDIRSNEYSVNQRLEISRYICGSLSLKSFNALTVRNSMGEDLSSVVSRNERAGYIAPLKFNDIVPGCVVALSLQTSLPKFQHDLDCEEWDFVLCRVMRQNSHPSIWRSLKMRSYNLTAEPIP